MQGTGPVDGPGFDRDAASPAGDAEVQNDIWPIPGDERPQPITRRTSNVTGNSSRRSDRPRRARAGPRDAPTPR